MLVTELCQFGDFFQLNAKIEEYLTAKTSVELYALVLARLDVDTVQPGTCYPSGRDCSFDCLSGEDAVLGQIMSALVASRNGLSEYELQVESRLISRHVADSGAFRSRSAFRQHAGRVCGFHWRTCLWCAQA